MEKLFWKNNTEGLLAGQRKHWRKDMRWKDVLVKNFYETLETDVLSKQEENCKSDWKRSV